MAPDPRTTGFLDDFVRGSPPGPNIEDPLSFGGRWRHLYMSAPNHWIKLRSNGVDGAVELFEGSGGSGQAVIWYQPYSGDVEAWGIGAGGVYDLREGLRMYLHISHLSDISAFPVSTYGHRGWTGYFVESLFGVLGTGTDLYKTNPGGIDSGVTLLDSAGGFTIDPGGGIAVFRTIDDQVELWHAPSSDPTNFSLILSATDATYRYGYIGIGTQQDDNNPSWAGFGGGQIVKTQFYRRLRN